MSPRTTPGSEKGDGKGNPGAGEEGVLGRIAIGTFRVFVLTSACKPIISLEHRSGSPLGQLHHCYQDKPAWGEEILGAEPRPAA